MSKTSALLLLPGALIVFFSLLFEGSVAAALGCLLVGSALFIESNERRTTQSRLAKLEALLQEERRLRLIQEAAMRAWAARAAEAPAHERPLPNEQTATPPVIVDVPAAAVVPGPAAMPSPEIVPATPTLDTGAAPAVLAQAETRPSALLVTVPATEAAAVEPTPIGPGERPVDAVATPPTEPLKALGSVTPWPSNEPPLAAQSLEVSVAPPVGAQPEREATVPIPQGPGAPAPEAPPSIAAAISTEVEGPAPAAKPERPAMTRPPAPALPRRPVEAPNERLQQAKQAPPRRSLLDLEQVLGVNWLSKVGVAILVIGVSFFLAWQLRQLGPLGKDIVGAIVGLALLGGGIWGEKSERYRIFGRAILAGGWALLFFVAYATHHVAAARVIDSPLGALLLMMIVAAAMVAHTLRYRSQVVTGLAFGLMFVTVALNRADVASLSASVILAIGFSVIVVRMRWFELEVVGIAATYANHFLWLRPIIEPMHGKGHQFPEFYTSAAILILYWAIFRIAFVLRRPPDERTSALSGMLNTALLLVVMKYQPARPDLAFWMLLSLGVAEIALARLPVMRPKRTSFIVLTVVGAALVASAIPFRFAPSYVTPAWLIDAIVFSAAGIFTRERVYRRLGTAVAAATTLQLLWFPAARLATVRFGGGTAAHEWALGAICLAVMLVLYGESVWLPRKWPELFDRPLDQRAARVLGYAGAGVSVLAGWVLFPDSGAAVFWAAFAVLLIVVRKKLAAGDAHLTVHALLVAIAAMARAVTVNLPSDELLNTASHMTWRLATVAAIAALLYLLSRLTATASEGAEFACRIGGMSGATALLVLLAWYELPGRHVAAAWVILAFALAVVARRWKASHVAIQANAVAALAVGRAVMVNLPSGDVAAASPLYLTWRVVTVLLVSALLYLLSRWNAAGALTSGPGFFVLPLWGGTSLLVILQWYELKSLAVAIGWTLSALALALAGRRVQRFHLTIQANVVAAAAVLRVAIVNLAAGDLLLDGRIHVTWRVVAVGLLAAVLYLMARLNATGALEKSTGAMIAPLWAAAGLLTVLPWMELQPQAVVIAWTALAFAFAAIGHRFRLSHLMAQANFVATVAAVKVFALDMQSSAVIVDGPIRVTWRAVSVCAVAALLYTLSRWNIRGDFEVRPSFAIVPRAVATVLLVVLAWHELQSVAVVLAWSAVGFALLAVGRRFRIGDVALHANAVAIAATVGSIVVNLPSSAVAFAAVPWRLLAVPAAVALLYSLSRWNSLDVVVPESREHELRNWQSFNGIDVERIYCTAPMWLATALLSLLAWYQLRPASVVLAWTILALALLETGFARRSHDLVLQAFVLMFVVFGRVFVVNMNIDDAGTIGARAYTIAPIVVAFLYVYARGDGQGDGERAKRLAPAFAWMAIICAAALLRFEMAADAVVAGWAALTTATVAVGFLVRRRVFSHIGIAVAAAAFVRGIVHNLYERSYFPPPGRFDRWIYIGAAAALLVASLAFAFRTRTLEPTADRRPMQRLAHWLDARPEQILFFIPLLLVTGLIGTEMRTGMLTVSWGIEAVVVFVFALWVRERSYRLASIALLLLCVAKVFVIDFWSLNLRDKALTGIVMGLALIGVSLLYTRKREAILQFL